MSDDPIQDETVEPVDAGEPDEPGLEPEAAEVEPHDGAADETEAQGAERPTAAEGPSSADTQVRMIEALLFASAEPLDRKQLAERLPPEADVDAILAAIEQAYAARGVNLVCVAGRWTFRTAPDLAFLLRKDTHEQKKLSRAGVETLAIIAYHQPVTRAEIEEIRGVAVSKGTIDVLMETGWITPRGRRDTPGKPLLFGTTDAFLDHFGLASIRDLPGLEELKAAGMLDAVAPAAPVVGEEGELPEPEDEGGPLDEPLRDGDDEPPPDGLNDGA